MTAQIGEITASFFCTSAGTSSAIFRPKSSTARRSHRPITSFVVLDEQHGDTVVVDGLDQLAQLAGLGGVHARRRFVEGQQLGLGGQGAGDLQAALITMRGSSTRYRQSARCPRGAAQGALGDEALLLPACLVCSRMEKTVGRERM